MADIQNLDFYSFLSPSSDSFCPLHEVMKNSKHVTIDLSQLKNEVDTHFKTYTLETVQSKVCWTDIHYFSTDEELTSLYVMILDVLNFCFWPANNYHYNDLANQLKLAFLEDSSQFYPKKLMNLNQKTLEKWLVSKSGCAIPLIEERIRLIRELGYVLFHYFQNSSSCFIKSAHGSASQLVNLITKYLPGFRDSSLYNGYQVFFYKRAQILVADLYLAFQGKGLGFFNDIHSLTCFADYRLPQLLSSLGIVNLINSQEIIPSQSSYEVEIRAATIIVVEIMINFLKEHQIHLDSIQLDWLLWHRAESLADTLNINPHHRTLSIFY